MSSIPWHQGRLGSPATASPEDPVLAASGDRRVEVDGHGLGECATRLPLEQAHLGRSLADASPSLSRSGETSSRQRRYTGLAALDRSSGGRARGWCR